MNIEKERKFLVDPKFLPAEAFGIARVIEAGYFTNGPEYSNMALAWKYGKR
jgi:hypothetical protein